MLRKIHTTQPNSPPAGRRGAESPRQPQSVEGRGAQGETLLQLGCKVSTESPRRAEKGKGSAWAQSHVSAGTDPRALRSQRGLCQRAQGARPPNQESTRGDAGTHCPSLWGCECYCTKTAWLLKLGDVSLRCHVYVVFNLSYPGSRMTPWWKGLMRTFWNSRIHWWRASGWPDPCFHLQCSFVSAYLTANRVRGLANRPRGFL